MIRIANHAENRHPIITASGATSCEVKDLLALRNVNACIVHNPETLANIRKSQGLRYMATKGILVLSSSESLDDIKPREIKGKFNDGTQCDFYVFGIRRSSVDGNYLTTTEWTDLRNWLDENGGKANDLEELWDKATPIVRSLLWPSDEGWESAVALLLLCDGALIVLDPDKAALKKELIGNKCKIPVDLPADYWSVLSDEDRGSLGKFLRKTTASPASTIALVNMLCGPSKSAKIKLEELRSAHRDLQKLLEKR